MFWVGNRECCRILWGLNPIAFRLESKEGMTRAHLICP
jgi:hypothetical protein